MLTELNGKAGRVCKSALEGQLRCPLIVRPTSEDVVTGHLCQVLRVLNPRWWLSDLLNLALGAPRFHRQFFRGFKIEPWRNRPCYPRELLPWDEGSTQIDISLQWDNPATTVYIEMKYGSDLSMKTAGDNGQHGYPSDQLIRNARVGLMECGWFRQEHLFQIPPRDFVLLLCCPAKGHPLVHKYRDPEELRSSIPHSDRLIGLPRGPFIGELGYGDIVRVLRRQRCRFTRPERQLIDQLASYLEYKQQCLGGMPGNGKHRFPGFFG
jgi:hypothetical protein